MLLLRHQLPLYLIVSLFDIGYSKVGSFIEYPISFFIILRAHADDGYLACGHVHVLLGDAHAHASGSL